MKSLVRLSVSAALLAGTVALAPVAFAQEATQFDFNAVPSRLSRAEVVADLFKARADGTLVTGGEATEFAFDTTPSTLTRTQVVAEAIEAKRLGLLDHGEVNPPMATPAHLRMIAEAGRRAIAQSQISQR
ncbi:MAG TPA: DUF4148 domain-containing protein [Burkholderiaceae bacterium]|nr:DUF4148 domain-containing protein [Burkholderiaceae bacterium]